MAIEQAVRIDVVSDVVCPWCFLGQKRLDKAIAKAGITVVVNWRPFQLDPTIPAKGMDRKAYMLGKFGDEQRLREIHSRIEALGRADGIAFAFDAMKVAPNTLDAHRVIRWAGTSGPQTQHDLVRSLFRRYFELGQDIGDPSVLAQAAGDVGMDEAVVANLLATDSDRQAVLDEAATAATMGVTGVPCFLFEGKYAVMGAQESDALVNAIRQIAQTKAEGTQ